MKAIYTAIFRKCLIFMPGAKIPCVRTEVFCGREAHGDSTSVENRQELDYVRWKAFLDELCYGYEHIMSGGRNVLFKLKEVWSYMITFFPESEKYGKKIKKAKTVEEYQRIVDTLFREMGIV